MQSKVIKRFEAAIASINEAQDKALAQATRALEEAIRARDDARRSHAEVTSAFVDMMKGFLGSGSTVAISEAVEEHADEEFEDFTGFSAGAFEDGGEGNAEGEDEVEDGAGAM